MPVVAMHMRRGRDATAKKAMLDAVHAALVEHFKVPGGNRMQRVAEYAPEDFEVPEGAGEGFVIVEIAVFPGRSLDAKRALYKGIVERFDALGIPPSDVFISLRETPLDDTGIRGGVPASDTKLGYRLDV